LTHAKSLAAAAAVIKRDPTGFDAVYLHELMNDASGIEWKNAYAKLPASQRLPLLVGTTSLNVRSTPAVRYIKRPFGMGLFVEMMAAAFEKAGDVAAVAGKNAPNALAGVPVRYLAPATLVGLDEAGGVLQVRFPLLKGSKLLLTHPTLGQLEGGLSIVQVTATAVAPSRPDIWHARFESIAAGMSKVKYWERVAKHLASSGDASTLVAAEPQGVAKAVVAKAS
jgi:hypothetical protein